jgi:hypothetical protein
MCLTLAMSSSCLSADPSLRRRDVSFRSCPCHHIISTTKLTISIVAVPCPVRSVPTPTHLFQQCATLFKLLREPAIGCGRL